MSYQITKVQISGITCGACIKVIEKRLKRIDGINEIKVQLQNGDTDVVADRQISNDEINQALEGTHYKAIGNL
ncbi:hypothetical protein A3F03_04685 [Candidatus Roizmanbacteria bacterium RIFCSPHIGHO2_12_FULL_41_11]|uniref:HMA domain-containing protein n=3 Tax=Candidatus Roizmaniibacteriota TaxID=1752723 RepID=A0A1F7JRZ8_9BACT|nr:MAG: hypothetical protein A3F03_04685 [Candidatus Roizmanbacteria bacterium RIFCSPHIGHO2_12_FULL_41_11]OGK51834.1 MAG: hypothetical protein A2966_00435 [Candidatus Roizmanbacteria bacterium RIFCSPLOWO2_01_FULL_41_22]OGK58405.1 MAG: hypothetical protein A3H86_04200 [Candidatus Roizmanbacteria bacterium RIFCSPLOWO2_02_FULL_41_9]